MAIFFSEIMKGKWCAEAQTVYKWIIIGMASSCWENLDIHIFSRNSKIIMVEFSKCEVINQKFQKFLEQKLPQRNLKLCYTCTLRNCPLFQNFQKILFLTKISRNSNQNFGPNGLEAVALTDIHVDTAHKILPSIKKYFPNNQWDLPFEWFCPPHDKENYNFRQSVDPAVPLFESSCWVFFLCSPSSVWAFHCWFFQKT